MPRKPEIFLKVADGWSLSKTLTISRPELKLEAARPPKDKEAVEEEARPSSLYDSIYQPPYSKE